MIYPIIGGTIYPILLDLIDATIGDSPSAPVNVVPPVIAGAVYANQILTCNDGAWSGSPAPVITRQWKRNGVDIGGATSSTYAATITDEGKSITCSVTATNALGSPSATSNTLRHFVPTDLGATLVAWLDALDSGTIAIATGVSQWNDKSGNANHFAQSTGANQPPYTAGTYPYIGINNIAGTVGLTSVKAFSAYQAYTLLQYKTGVESTFGGQETMYSGPGGLGVNRFLMANAGTSSISGGGTIDIGLAKKNAGSASATVLPMPWSIVVSDLSVNTSQVWTIGCNGQSAGRTWTGFYREIILLNAIASAGNQQKLEGYYAWKWNLLSVLPGGHPYKTVIPTP